MGQTGVRSTPGRALVTEILCGEPFCGVCDPIFGGAAQIGIVVVGVKTMSHIRPKCANQCGVFWDIM